MYPDSQLTHVPSVKQLAQFEISQTRVHNLVDWSNKKPVLQVAQVEAVVQETQLGSSQIRVQVDESELRLYPS